MSEYFAESVALKVSISNDLYFCIVFHSLFLETSIALKEYKSKNKTIGEVVFQPFNLFLKWLCNAWR